MGLFPVILICLSGAVVLWDGAMYANLQCTVPVLVFLIYGALRPAYFVRMFQCEKRQKIAAVLVGFLFACFTFLGRELRMHGTLEKFFAPYLLLQNLVHFLSLFVLFSFAVLFLLDLATSRVSSLENQLRFSPSFWVLWLLIFLCWLPYFFAFYPACLSDDSLWELDIALQQKPLSNHHPIIHIFTILPFVRFGRLIGSISLGVGLYTLFQMLVMSALFAYAIVHLRKSGVPAVVQFVIFLFYALLSIHAFYSISMWKDIFFAGATLLLMVLLVRIASSEAGACSPLSCLALTLCLFVFCTYRHNGYYAFLLAFPLFLLFNRRFWKRLLVVGVAVFLLTNAYQVLIFDVLGATPSATAEKLSVPMQQIARIAALAPDAFTAEEKQIIEEVFPSVEKLGQLYAPNISDPVKSTFNSAAFDSNPARYAKLWLQLGLRHPLIYLDAFFNQCYGYWYPDVSRWSIYAMAEPNAYGLAHRPSQMIAALVSLHYSFQDAVPFSFLFRPGTYTWLLVLAAAILFARRKSRLLSPMLFLAFLFLTTLLSPVHAEFRYVYGLVVSAPFFLGLALACSAE